MEKQQILCPPTWTATFRTRLKLQLKLHLETLPSKLRILSTKFRKTYMGEGIHYLYFGEAVNLDKLLSVIAPHGLGQSCYPASRSCLQPSGTIPELVGILASATAFECVSLHSNIILGTLNYRRPQIPAGGLTILRRSWAVRLLSHLGHLQRAEAWRKGSDQALDILVA